MLCDPAAGAEGLRRCTLGRSCGGGRSRCAARGADKAVEDLRHGAAAIDSRSQRRQIPAGGDGQRQYRIAGHCRSTQGPDPVGSGATPVRARRARSASVSAPVMPVWSAHRPQHDRHRRTARRRRRRRRACRGRRWRRRSCPARRCRRCRRPRRRARKRARCGLRGELVQMPGAVGLGRQRLVEMRGGQRGDRGVVQDAGGVHDAGQRPVGGDRVQQRGDRAAVRRHRRLRWSPTRRGRSARSPARRRPGLSAPRREASSRCRTPCDSTRRRRQARRGRRCRR